MQAFGCQHMGRNQVVQGLQRYGAGAHLVGQGRQAEIDAFARVAVALPVQRLASRAGESHPHALPEPYVSLSTHTAPSARPYPNGFAPVIRLLLSPVGRRQRLNTTAPSVQRHYSAFIPTTGCSAPVPRHRYSGPPRGLPGWSSPLALGRQVLLFRKESLFRVHAAYEPDAA